MEHRYINQFFVVYLKFKSNREVYILTGNHTPRTISFLWDYQETLLSSPAYPSPSPQHTKPLPEYSRCQLETFLGAQVSFLQ